MIWIRIFPPKDWSFFPKRTKDQFYFPRNTIPIMGYDIIVLYSLFLSFGDVYNSSARACFSKVPSAYALSYENLWKFIIRECSE